MIVNKNIIVVTTNSYFCACSTDCATYGLYFIFKCVLMHDTYRHDNYYNINNRLIMSRTIIYADYLSMNKNICMNKHNTYSYLNVYYID